MRKDDIEGGKGPTLPFATEEPYLAVPPAADPGKELEKKKEGKITIRPY